MGQHPGFGAILKIFTRFYKLSDDSTIAILPIVGTYRSHQIAPNVAI
jgi:uncharacterized membrane protein